MVELNASWGVTLTEPVASSDRAVACAEKAAMMGSSQNMSITDCVCSKKEWMPSARGLRLLEVKGSKECQE
jgi:hypothetical protein